jgi:hypothetical protein
MPLSGKNFIHENGSIFIDFIVSRPALFEARESWQCDSFRNEPSQSADERLEFWPFGYRRFRNDLLPRQTVDR